MKIKDEKIVDISMGISDEKTFKLDQESGILYDILRSKMYRDPISSIVREIASNSRDANREAGRADVPIKVFFTNNDDERNYLFDNDSTAINFQDNGLGMTPDRIEDIYLTYGASDKRGTDNLTGGWGLGAKTPFAHADCFTVITICDYQGQRKKYTYIASVDSTNKGKFSLVEEEETDEETGTTVSMPIEKGYVEKFKEACRHYFQYWDIEIAGFPIIQPTKVYDTHNVYDVNTKNTEIFLIIDGIYYPLMDHKDLNVKDWFEELGIKMKIGLKFKTGELAVQPSREDVRYTDETIAAINKRLDSLNFDEILKDAFKGINCVNFSKFTLPQLYRNAKFIEDEKLKSLIVTFFPKYKKGRNYSLPQIPYLKVFRNEYSSSLLSRSGSTYESGVNLEDLIRLVASNSVAYVLSPSTEKFTYKRNKLAVIKNNANHLIFKNLQYIDDETANELLVITNCLSSIKFDHEIKYIPPQRKTVGGFTGISFRYFNGSMLNLKDMESCNAKVDPDKDYVIFVDKLETVDKLDNDYLKNLIPVLRFIKNEHKHNFVFVSERYRKHFQDNPSFEAYIKTNEYKNARVRFRKLSKDSAIVNAIQAQLNSHTAYFLYDDLDNDTQRFLKSPKDMKLCRWSGDYLDKEKVKSAKFGVGDLELEEEYNKKLKALKEEKGKLMRLVENISVQGYLDKELLDQFKTLKNVTKQNV